MTHSSMQKQWCYGYAFRKVSTTNVQPTLGAAGGQGGHAFVPRSYELFNKQKNTSTNSEMFFYYVRCLV